MENPFAYSNYVTGRSFCNRKNEISDLLKYIKGSQNVLMYSHRRYGKSSLIKQVFQIIEEQKLNIDTMYVELYGTVNEKDFIVKTFKALNQLESNFEKLIKTVNNVFKSFKLDLKIDPETGETSVTPSFNAVNEKFILEELMKILNKYSQKRKLVVAFDEFQEIAEYKEDGFEKRLRSLIQSHSNICYIFAGSQQHIITEMFNSNKRAFYKLADSLPLKKIETKNYIAWIKKIFKKKDFDLTDGLIKEVISRFENHPMYIQNFLFHLWEEDEYDQLTLELIDKIEKTIIDKKDLEFTILWENLTVNQKKTLKLIIINKGKNLFNADSLNLVSIKSGSIVSKTLSNLVKKGIVAKNGHYIIQDVVFKKWLERIL